MKNRHHIVSKLFGFSLLELMVVIVLIGGLILVAIISINSLTGVEIKSEVTKIAGLMTEVYGRAALGGKTQRIVFDLDNNKYWVEEKSADVGDNAPVLGYEEQMKQARERQKQGEDEREGDRFLPKFKPVEGDLGQTMSLPNGLVFRSAWTEQMDKPADSDIVSIYFFPDGYALTSYISIADKDDNENSIYIALSPLTGAIKTDYGEPDINDLLSEERENNS